MKAGKVVDATLIAAPSSTKNKNGQRNLEMHQSNKGNQWFFGMSSHIGVDAASALVHTGARDGGQRQRRGGGRAESTSQSITRT